MELSEKEIKYYSGRGRNFSMMPKNYSKMNENGWDAFVMLGESKTYKDLAQIGGDLHQVVVKVLKEEGYNEYNTPEKLSKITGIPFSTFNELTAVLEEVYMNNISIDEEKRERVFRNDEINNFLETFVPEINKTMLRVSDRMEKFTPKDLVALTQYRRLHSSEKIKNYLTKEEIEKKGLRLPENAIPEFIVQNGKKKEVYDWASVIFYKHKDVFEVPMKNYYTNELIFTKNSGSYENSEKFANFLREKKYKIERANQTVFESDNVIIKGKKLVIGLLDISQVEQDALIMYQLNKQALKRRRGLFSDPDYKEAKKFFRYHFFLRGVNAKYYDEADKMNPVRKFNAYRGITSDKRNFDENKEVLQEVIATLATINQARIYMDGEAFKKLENHLQLQASMKMAMLPRSQSTWMLPYVAEKVLQLSKKNYMEAGITTAEQLKTLYENTGRKVEGLETFDEIIFSRLDKSLNYNKNTGSEKEASKEKETAKQKTQTSESDYEYSYEELERTPLAQLLRRQKKEAEDSQNKQPVNVTEEKNAQQGIVTNQQEGNNGRKQKTSIVKEAEDSVVDNQNNTVEQGKPIEPVVDSVNEPEQTEPIVEPKPEPEVVIDPNSSKSDIRFEQEDIKEEDVETKIKIYKKELETAQNRLFLFLKENLLMENKLSEAMPIRFTQKYIQKLNETTNIDMKKVTKSIYEEIANDMEGNPAAYQKEDGNFHKDGWRLFKDYFNKSKTAKYSFDVNFKKMLSDTVKEVQSEEIDVEVFGKSK